MIQDIYPHKLWNEYNPNPDMKDTDYVLVFDQKGSALMKKETTVEFPTVSMVKNKEELTYLFKVDDTNYFLSTEDNIIEHSFEFYPPRFIFSDHSEDQHKVYALTTGKHLFDWYRDNQYCGRCGKKMHHDEKERCMVCQCGNRSYPRIMPAVIVGVLNKDKILVTRYREGYGYNALIAGFCEIGETVEETVAREVMEEAGIKVKNIRYYKSQPWGIANDILLGYYCEVDGDDTIQLDKNELRYGAWLTQDELELQPNNYSLTNEMMRMFKEGKIEEFYQI